MMSCTVGNGRRITSEDVVKVAVLKYTILLDVPNSSNPSKVSNNSHQLTKSTNYQGLEVQSTEYIPTCIIRSGIFCRIISLCQGNAHVSFEFINVLTEILNSNLLPNIRSSDCERVGEIFISHILQTHNISTISSIQTSPITLGENEKASLQHFPFLAIGLACLISSGLQNILQISDSLCALSCEAFSGIQLSSFDPTYFELNRPHRGHILSCTNLKLLLEGSRRIANASSNELMSANCFHEIPQSTGSCLEIVKSLSKLVEIELNSSESAPLDNTKGIIFSAEPVKIMLHSMIGVLDTLTTSSRSRTTVLSTKLPQESALAITFPEENEIGNFHLNTYSKLERLFQSLVTEVHISLTILGSGVANLKATDGIDGATQGTDAVGEAEDNLAQFKSKGIIEKGEKEDNLTPAQKAKAEAKRKLKAEKALEKAAAKAAKKSNSSVLALGHGSNSVRNWIYSLNLGSNEIQNVDVHGLKIEIIHSALDPFNQYEEASFRSFCSRLLEQLNSSGGNRKPRIPKGARDFTPDQMRIREQAFAVIRQVFKRHGGVEIDTPVFELKEVLMGKYGEDSKLIYDLADQGGELLSLRYDLTVPFARFLAMNSVGNIKRYHIAKVYRRDQPQVTRGRYREFYQCDFDIAGNFAPMLPDAEVITVATEILTSLPIGTFIIKLNHRKLLDAIFEICGVPTEKFRTICSAVDKLDKLEWSEVKLEMVEEKGLDSVVADRIGQYVLHKGKPYDLWKSLTEQGLFAGSVGAESAMQELKLLFEYLDAMGSLEYVSFDLSLARGLDYYTGVIYEAVITDGTSQVGSIAAGGRYDNLVGMFNAQGAQTPCVGVSIGIERVFTIMENKAKESEVNQISNIQVFIASIGVVQMTEKMKIAKLLWQANISAEYSHQEKPRLATQLNDARARNIPYVVFVGEAEITKGVVNLKILESHTEMEIPVIDLVKTLIELGCAPVSAAADLKFLEALKK